MSYYHDSWILRIEAITDPDSDGATLDLLADLGENIRSWQLSDEQRGEVSQALNGLLIRSKTYALKASVFSILRIACHEKAVEIANRLLPEVTTQVMVIGQLLHQVVNTASLGFELTTAQQSRSALDIDESLTLAQRALISRS